MRQGQATVEWIALVAICALVGLGGMHFATGISSAVNDIAPLIATIATPSPIEPVRTLLEPNYPSLRADPLPRIDGGSIVLVASRLAALQIVETPTGSNFGPAIAVFTDGNAEPWCADFVSWVLRAAGYPFSGGASGGWRIAWTLDVRAWFAARGAYRERLVADPAPGDVIWFRHGHIGIVTRVTGSSIETVEGNAGDAVRSKVYAQWRSNSAIGGFGRPAR